MSKKAQGDIETSENRSSVVRELMHEFAEEELGERNSNTEIASSTAFVERGVSVLPNICSTKGHQLFGKNGIDSTPPKRLVLRTVVDDMDIFDRFFGDDEPEETDSEDEDPSPNERARQSDILPDPELLKGMVDVKKRIGIIQYCVERPTKPSATFIMSSTSCRNASAE